MGIKISLGIVCFAMGIASTAGADVGFAPNLERGPGAGYNAKHYDKRVKTPKSILKRTQANRTVHAERDFTRRLGARTRANMTYRGDIARHARKSTHTKQVLANSGRTVKRAKTLRTVGKVAAGGVVVAGGIYAAEQTLGVDVPDVVDVGEWTYETLKDPRQADKRFAQLGRDSLREVDKGLRTLSNPKKMERNIVRSANKTGKSIKKAGCSVGKLFGAKC
jgi:hypothetical protein